MIKIKKLYLLHTHTQYLIKKVGKRFEKGWKKMKSCQELLAEMREKIINAKEQLVIEKKELCKLEEMVTNEKNKWSKVTSEKKKLMHINQKKIKAKRTAVENLKTDYEEKLKKRKELENENDKLKKEVVKARRNQQNSTDYVEIANLEGILNRIQDKQKSTKEINSWMKSAQAAEENQLNADNDKKFNEEVKNLSDE